MADEKKQILSDAVYDNALAAAQSGVRPTYAGTFENQLNDIYNKIENREKFSYDVNADPLYNAYKDKYVQQGKMAMQDTMGKAAALTGGYGSSYGQQVGQQTYNAYLQNLSDVIPQLYGMAQQNYESEGNRLKDLYSLTANQRDTEYNRYQNELSEFNYNQELARQQEQKDYERRIYDENLAYQKQQDAWTRALQMLQLGATPTDADLAAAGMTREQANAIRAQLFPTAGGGGGGYGGGSGSGGGGQQPVTSGQVWQAALDTATALKSAGVNSANGAYNAAVNAGYDEKDARTIQSAYVSNANAGVNRSAVGSPTAGTKNQGSTWTGTTNTVTNKPTAAKATTTIKKLTK